VFRLFGFLVVLCLGALVFYILRFLNVVLCSVINEAIISAEKMHLLLFTSPLGVVEYIARLRTQVIHRTGLLFRNVSTFQNLFSRRCFDLIYIYIYVASSSLFFLL
jgi:hypothetical protein